METINIPSYDAYAQAEISTDSVQALVGESADAAAYGYDALDNVDASSLVYVSEDSAVIGDNSNAIVISGSPVGLNDSGTVNYYSASAGYASLNPYYVEPTGYYNYTGGNETISNYEQYSQINLQTDFQGFETSGNNCIVKSSGGQLTIQNARNKFLKFGDNYANPLAYTYFGKGAYISSNSSLGNSYDSYRNIIDGRTKTDGLYELLIGADNTDNHIYAGSGGSSMWGGVGGNDTMTGGDGYDTFVYKVGSGNDAIRNASDVDTISLDEVSLDQITAVHVTSAAIKANFSDGGSLEVVGESNVGFRLGGTTYAVNRSNAIWTVKQ